MEFLPFISDVWCDQVTLFWDDASLKADFPAFCHGLTSLCGRLLLPLLCNTVLYGWMEWNFLLWPAALCIDEVELFTGTFSSSAEPC